jgi:hypothetical protein
VVDSGLGLKEMREGVIYWGCTDEAAYVSIRDECVVHVAMVELCLCVRVNRYGSGKKLLLSIHTYKMEMIRGVACVLSFLYCVPLFQCAIENWENKIK